MNFIAYCLAASVAVDDDFSKECGQKVVALIQEDPTVLAQNLYHTLLQKKYYGLELALYTGQECVLDALEDNLSFIQDVDKEDFLSLQFENFPATWKDKNLERAMRLWISFFSKEDQVEALIYILNHEERLNLSAYCEKSIFAILSTLSVDKNQALRISFYRMNKTPKSLDSAKQINKFFAQLMADESTSKHLVNELVCKRQMTEALVWLMIVGNGQGFDQPIKSQSEKGLFTKAVKALHSGHGSMALKRKILKTDLSLKSNQFINAALKKALETL
jgi:hypothetical protein